MKANIHFTCDPDFYTMALSYEDRDRWEGDLHVMCGGECEPGVPCECRCHTPEGELIYGERRRAVRAWQEANSRALEARETRREAAQSQFERTWEGRRLEKAGQPDEAASLYESVIAEEMLRGFPRSLPYTRLAVFYRKAGRLDDEVRVLNRAVEVFSAHLNGPLAANGVVVEGWRVRAVAAHLAEYQRQLARATARMSKRRQGAREAGQDEGSFPA
jgi:tetratricopeptide (TPR) repeat protein